MNPDTIGCVWTGEFDLNTLRVDGENFESGKKKLWIKKYPDTCARGLKTNGDFSLACHPGSCMALFIFLFTGMYG